MCNMCVLSFSLKCERYTLLKDKQMQMVGISNSNSSNGDFKLKWMIVKSNRLGLALQPLSPLVNDEHDMEEEEVVDAVEPLE